MSYEVPYSFVLQHLYPVRLRIVKMLGGYGLYLEKKLMLFLRNGDRQPEFNGVFVATHPQYFSALQQEVHHSKMDFDLDGSTDSWIFISEDLDDFEEKVKKACALVKAGDERIGK